jgi:hypothetical protein
MCGLREVTVEERDSKSAISQGVVGMLASQSEKRRLGPLQTIRRRQKKEVAHLTINLVTVLVDTNPLPEIG